MNKTSIYIAARIAAATNRQIWHSRKSEITETLDKLCPDVPIDNVPGFLAYNVDGHDRMKMKTGRFLTRKLKLNNGFLPDTVIQTIAAQINTKLFGAADIIRLDSGTQITENYKKCIGGSSCMTSGMAGCTGLYADNPKQIKQLVMLSVNDSARAIVHVLDNGQYHMSRIYSTSEELKQRMLDYAHKQKWLYRGDIIADRSVLIVSDLDYTDGQIPYADSLTGYRIGFRSLTMVDITLPHEGTLTSTNGFLSEYICTACGASINEDEAHEEDDEIYCDDCYCSHFTECDDCEEIYRTEDCTLVDSVNRYVCEECLRDNYSCCDECGDWYSNEELHSVNNGGECVCEPCLADNYSRCEDCGDWYSNGEFHLVNNGNKAVCEPCLMDNYSRCEDCGDWFTNLVEGTDHCEECEKTKDCEGQLLLPTI